MALLLPSQGVTGGSQYLHPPQLSCPADASDGGSGVLVTYGKGGGHNVAKPPYAFNSTRGGGRGKVNTWI